MDRKQIIILGSINMDIVVRTNNHPRAGETVMGSDVRFIPGGKGSNQAIAASRLGGHVRMVGCLGCDSFGDELYDFLAKEKVDISDVSRNEDYPTGTALITVDNHGENTIVVVAGSNNNITEEKISNIKINSGDFVVAQFETPLNIVQAFFDKAKQSKCITILNPAPAQYISKEFLELVDYLIVNETELAFLTQQDDVPRERVDIIRLAKSLCVRDSQIIIVTLGGEGVVAVVENEIIDIPGHNVKVVDTTGAGDCFIGAFVVALSEGQNIRSSIEFSNLVAALSVQRLGASSSLPTREEFDDYQNNI